MTLLNWLGTMSVKIRKSLVATALVGAFAFASTIHVFAVKCLGEVNSVDHMTLWSLDVQHSKDRWIKIDRLNANIAA